jgi:hypothetical protein
MLVCSWLGHGLFNQLCASVHLYEAQGHVQSNVVAGCFVMFPVTHARQCPVQGVAAYRLQGRSSLLSNSSAANAAIDNLERSVKLVGPDTLLMEGRFGQIVGKLLAHRLGTVPALGASQD